MEIVCFFPKNRAVIRFFYLASSTGHAITGGEKSRQPNERNGHGKRKPQVSPLRFFFLAEKNSVFLPS
jgi:hypothetical protein